MIECLLALLVVFGPQQTAANARATGATISGVVLSDDATPVPVRHARVELLGGAKEVIVTGDDGAFAFTGMAAGRYEIEVGKLGVGRRTFSANVVAATPTAIVVAPGQQLTGLRVVLPRGAVISGTVTDGAGAPLDGAIISAIRQGDDAARSAANDDRTVTAEADEDGRYRLFGLSAGQYLIRATPASGNARTSSVPVALQTFYPGAASPRDATPIAVASREERPGVDFATRRGKRVDVSGTTRDANGQPIDAEVRLLPVGAESDDDGLRVSARAGEFAFAGVGSGPFILRATHKGANDERGRPVLLAVTTPIEVSDRGETGISLVLQPPVTLSGRVTVAPGAPEGAAARLALERDDELFTAPLQADGTFVFSGLTPGAYSLRPLTIPETGTRAWAVESAMLDGRDVLRQPIEILGAAKSGLTVTVNPNVGGLSGRISAESGRGAPELAIVVMSADPQKRATSSGRPAIVWPDTNGDWKIDAVVAGDYLVAALGDVTLADLTRPDFLQAVAAGSVTVGVKAGAVAVQNLKIR